MGRHSGELQVTAKAYSLKRGRSCSGLPARRRQGPLGHAPCSLLQAHCSPPQRCWAGRPGCSLLPQFRGTGSWGSRGWDRGAPGPGRLPPAARFPPLSSCAAGKGRAREEAGGPGAGTSTSGYPHQSRETAVPTGSSAEARGSSDWFSLGHMSTPKPIAKVGGSADWSGPGRKAASWEGCLQERGWLATPGRPRREPEADPTRADPVVLGPWFSS